MTATWDVQHELRKLYDAHAEHVDGMFTALDDGEKYEGSDAAERISETAYGVDVERHLLITLAGGGPSAHLDATIDRDDTLTGVEWVGTWWSPEVRVRVPKDSGLWRLAEWYTVEGCER